MQTDLELIEQRFQTACKQLHKTGSWRPENQTEEQYLSDAIVIFCEEAMRIAQAKRDAGHELTVFELASEALAQRLLYVPVGNKDWNTVLPYPFMPKSELLAHNRKRG